MITDVLLWLPTKVAKRMLRPVITMFDDIDRQIQATNDYIKENTP